MQGIVGLGPSKLSKGLDCYTTSVNKYVVYDPKPFMMYLTSKRSMFVLVSNLISLISGIAN